jgi:hypothetical protein
MTAPWNASPIHVRLTPLELDQLRGLLARTATADSTPLHTRFVDYVAFEDKLSDAVALACWKRDCHEIELTFDEVELLTELVAANDTLSDPQVETVSRLRALTTRAATGLPA